MCVYLGTKSFSKGYRKLATMSDSSERNQELENTTNHFCIDPEESYVFKLFFTSKKFYGLSMHLKNYKSNF